MSGQGNPVPENLTRGRDGNVITCKGTKKYVSECLVCHSKVVIHCADCGKQITGCGCTIREGQDRTTLET